MLKAPTRSFPRYLSVSAAVSTFSVSSEYVRVSPKTARHSIDGARCSEDGASAVGILA